MEWEGIKVKQELCDCLPLLDHNTDTGNQTNSGSQHSSFSSSLLCVQQKAIGTIMLIKTEPDDTYTNSQEMLRRNVEASLMEEGMECRAEGSKKSLNNSHDKSPSNPDGKSSDKSVIQNHADIQRAKVSVMAKMSETQEAGSDREQEASSSEVAVSAGRRPVRRGGSLPQPSWNSLNPNSTAFPFPKVAEKRRTLFGLGRLIPEDRVEPPDEKNNIALLRYAQYEVRVWENSEKLIRDREVLNTDIPYKFRAVVKHRIFPGKEAPQWMKNMYYFARVKPCAAYNARLHPKRGFDLESLYQNRKLFSVSTEVLVHFWDNSALYTEKLDDEWVVILVKYDINDLSTDWENPVPSSHTLYSKAMKTNQVLMQSLKSNTFQDQKQFRIRHWKDVPNLQLYPEIHLAPVIDTGSPANEKRCLVMEYAEKLKEHLPLEETPHLLGSGNYSGRKVADCIEYFPGMDCPVKGCSYPLSKKTDMQEWRAHWFLYHKATKELTICKLINCKDNLPCNCHFTRGITDVRRHIAANHTEINLNNLTDNVLRMCTISMKISAAKVEPHLKLVNPDKMWVLLLKDGTDPRARSSQDSTRRQSLPQANSEEWRKMMDEVDVKSDQSSPSSVTEPRQLRGGPSRRSSPSKDTTKMEVDTVTGGFQEVDLTELKAAKEEIESSPPALSLEASSRFSPPNDELSPPRLLRERRSGDKESLNIENQVTKTNKHMQNERGNRELTKEETTTNENNKEKADCQENQSDDAEEEMGRYLRGRKGNRGHFKKKTEASHDKSSAKITNENQAHGEENKNKTHKLHIRNSIESIESPEEESVKTNREKSGENQENQSDGVEEEIRKNLRGRKGNRSNKNAETSKDKSDEKVSDGTENKKELDKEEKNKSPKRNVRNPVESHENHEEEGDKNITAKREDSNYEIKVNDRQENQSLDAEEVVKYQRGRKGNRSHLKRKHEASNDKFIETVNQKESSEEKKSQSPNGHMSTQNTSIDHAKSDRIKKGKEKLDFNHAKNNTDSQGMQCEEVEKEKGKCLRGRKGFYNDKTDEMERSKYHKLKTADKNDTKKSPEHQKGKHKEKKLNQIVDLKHLEHQDQAKKFHVIKNGDENGESIEKRNDRDGSEKGVDGTENMENIKEEKSKPKKRKTKCKRNRNFRTGKKTNRKRVKRTDTTDDVEHVMDQNVKLKGKTGDRNLLQSSVENQKNSAEAKVLNISDDVEHDEGDAIEPKNKLTDKSENMNLLKNNDDKNQENNAENDLLNELDEEEISKQRLRRKKMGRPVRVNPNCGIFYDDNKLGRLYLPFGYDKRNTKAKERVIQRLLLQRMHSKGKDILRISERHLRKKVKTLIREFAKVRHQVLRSPKVEIEPLTEKEIVEATAVIETEVEGITVLTVLDDDDEISESIHNNGIHYDKIDNAGEDCCPQASTSRHREQSSSQNASGSDASIVMPSGLTALPGSVQMESSAKNHSVVSVVNEEGSVMKIPINKYAPFGQSHFVIPSLDSDQIEEAVTDGNAVDNIPRFDPMGDLRKLGIIMDVSEIKGAQPINKDSMEKAEHYIKLASKIHKQNYDELSSKYDKLVKDYNKLAQDYKILLDNDLEMRKINYEDLKSLQCEIKNTNKLNAKLHADLEEERLKKMLKEKDEEILKLKKNEKSKVTVTSETTESIRAKIITNLKAKIASIEEENKVLKQFYLAEPKIHQPVLLGKKNKKGHETNCTQSDSGASTSKQPRSLLSSTGLSQQIQQCVEFIATSSPVFKLSKLNCQINSIPILLPDNTFYSIPANGNCRQVALNECSAKWKNKSEPQTTAAKGQKRKQTIAPFPTFLAGESSHNCVEIQNSPLSEDRVRKKRRYSLDMTDDS